MQTLLDTTLAAITAVDKSLQPAVLAHLDDLTKPPKSLGRLEEIALRYCLATHSPKPTLGHKRIVCFAADHGVADEGVSAYPKEVTPQMVMNMLAGGAAVNILSRHAKATLDVVDIGVAYDFGAAPGLCQRKIRWGTGNMARGPAMSVDEARRAIEVGIELAHAAHGDGIRLIGTGDMGIANTTPSTALFTVFLKIPVEEITGRGTGINDKGLSHKIAVIEKALEINKAHLTDPLHILAAVGGLEIAGICGLILGAASHKMAVVVDGFISSAGALVAMRMKPEVEDYLFFSHMSHEKGHRHIMKLMGIRPVLDLDMRLGEGTGAALAMPIIEAAVKIYNEMETFSSAGVSNKDEK